MAWIDSLPNELAHDVRNLARVDDENASILLRLYNHLTDTKRRKVSNGGSEPRQHPKQENGGDDDSPIKYITEHQLLFEQPVDEKEIIFEIPQISFQSPIRKKLNLTFHLLLEEGKDPNPVLLAINPITSVPELSFTNLLQLIRLCVVLPILKMSTSDTKKNIGSLCVWFNDQASVDPSKNDPIVCQINFDVLKKHLIKTGKIPATAETHLDDGSDEGIRPINEHIINFLQRQFELCGVHLSNYLPSSDPRKNKLSMNQDSGIALSSKANTVNDMVMVEAYKGAKDGSIVLINKTDHTPAYFIFGFKKPILIFELSQVETVSYANITRLTFSIIIAIKKKDSRSEILDLGLIDQKYFQLIDDFFKIHNINDNSYDDKLKEPSGDQKLGPEGETNGEKAADDDDDEEDDGNYQGGEEEEDEDVAEEYDSNAEGEGSGEEGSGEEGEEGSGEEGPEEEGPEEEEVNQSSQSQSQPPPDIVEID